MEAESFNNNLREIFTSLINDGYKKRKVCMLTLGEQNEPQFENFLKGTDFGIKPLQRLMKNLDYKLQVIITPSDDVEVSKFVEENNRECFESCKQYLVNNLENGTVPTLVNSPKRGPIVDISNELFNEIIK